MAGCWPSADSCPADDACFTCRSGGGGKRGGGTIILISVVDSAVKVVGRVEALFDDADSAAKVGGIILGDVMMNCVVST